MKLEGWKAMEAAMNRRLAREQWADAEAYDAELRTKFDELASAAGITPERIRVRRRRREEEEQQDA